ncbi:MAG TPA: glycoside hydrolase family 127 protein, partial [Bryobacteraceae bacterium]
QRSPWFGVACCPSNITRFMPSIPGYVYAKTSDAIWVNLFMSNEAKIDMGATAGIVRVTQDTRYPWDGAVKMTVEPEHPAKLTIHVRIPGWARNEPVPGDLYHFANRARTNPVLKVNGKPVAIALEKGYANITREWKTGDTIDLDLPMPVRRVLANGEVAADRGRVALERGPIVYAAEWVDNPKEKVRNVMLPDSAAVTAEFKPDLLKGVTVLKTHAVALSYDAQGKIVKTKEDLVAIPYYAWANRGRGQMIVWLPNSEASAKPAPYPTIATMAKVTTSGRKSPEPIHDGEAPETSDDHSSYFDWWPTKGSTEWVEYAFDKPAAVSECELYWFDDTGHGEVRVPQNWRILYKDAAGQWVPVNGSSAYGVDKDKFNRVTFQSISTSGLRLEVTMQPKFSAGLQEWKVK